MLNPHWGGHVGLEKNDRFMLCRRQRGSRGLLGKFWYFLQLGGFPLAYCSNIRGVFHLCPSSAGLSTLFPLLWFCSCRALVLTVTTPL